MENLYVTSLAAFRAALAGIGGVSTSHIVTDEEDAAVRAVLNKVSAPIRAAYDIQTEAAWAAREKAGEGAGEEELAALDAAWAAVVREPQRARDEAMGPILRGRNEALGL